VSKSSKQTLFLAAGLQICVASLGLSSNAATYQVKLICGSVFHVGRVQFGLKLPPEADAATAVFGGGCEAPPPSGLGCSNADPSKLGDTVDRDASFVVRGVPGTNPSIIYFSLMGMNQGGLPDLCGGSSAQLLAKVDVALSEDQPATLSQENSHLVNAQVPAYEHPPRPVLDPYGFPQTGTWVYVTDEGTTGLVKLLHQPAVDSNSGHDWVLKLESPLEFKRVKVGVVDPTGSSEFLGCDEIDCSAGEELVGPTVDLNASRSEHSTSNGGIRYLVLEGDLEASVPYQADHTLLHVPSPPNPSRVTLGVLRMPDAYVQPVLTFVGVSTVPPIGSAPYGLG
jgi:hypothetical protein